MLGHLSYLKERKWIRVNSGEERLDKVSSVASNLLHVKAAIFCSPFAREQGVPVLIRPRVVHSYLFSSVNGIDGNDEHKVTICSIEHDFTEHIIRKARVITIYGVVSKHCCVYCPVSSMYRDHVVLAPSVALSENFLRSV